jgi:uncharacterized membrane protein
MLKSRSALLFLILVAGAAVFVWLTSRHLPEVVASHFGASGAANGFMPRALYLRFTLALVVALPLFVVVLPSLALGSAQARINLPNREYWLAPERRAGTIAFIREHMARFGSLLVVFLCYVHWLVLRANAMNPPGLPAAWFIGGLATFVIIAILWTVSFLGRFRGIHR